MNDTLLIILILTSVVMTAATFFLIKWIRKRRAALKKKELPPETSSIFFVPTSKYNGTLAMVVKNILPPSIRRTHDMSGKQALQFKIHRDDLKVDGWASDGHIQGEYHDLGDQRYYVYIQPMRKGRRGIELEDFLTEFSVSIAS